MAILLCAHSRTSTKKQRPTHSLKSSFLRSFTQPPAMRSKAAEVPYTIGRLSFSIGVIGGGSVSGIVVYREGPVEGLTDPVMESGIITGPGIPVERTTP